MLQGSLTLLDPEGRMRASGIATSSRSPKVGADHRYRRLGGDPFFSFALSAAYTEQLWPCRGGLIPAGYVVAEPVPHRPLPRAKHLRVHVHAENGENRGVTAISGLGRIEDESADVPRPDEVRSRTKHARVRRVLARGDEPWTRHASMALKWTVVSGKHQTSVALEGQSFRAKPSDEHAGQPCSRFVSANSPWQAFATRQGTVGPPHQP
ncbi:hypothetical protein DCS_02134 [Drechmeria coniospora]|uniref:Uncharacterized protein n=1 Tax=Drechmeria coniospora TaxID=98403 RepID=A0A151GV70_DRECN|nr:hypothetical protein DCS_02134 [Drechmeria coniospora]KYK60994.1 hypothetical protein DCS_02134 [Drechmeria coniospora]